MKSNGPSYLFKNQFGVFHFRARIPSPIRLKYRLKQKVFQQSLKTKNRHEALNLARRLWVKMTDTDWLKKFEEAVANDDEMLEEGRRLDGEYNAIANDPKHLPSDFDEFFGRLSPLQIEAHNYYVDYLASNSNQTKSPHEGTALTPTNNQVQNQSISLTEAYEEFYSIHFEQLQPKTGERSRSVFNQFIEVVGDIPCSHLTREHLINFRNVMIKLPKRVDLPPYKGKSYKDILTMEIPENKKAAQKTFKNKFGYILNFLDSCEDNGYIAGINHRQPFRQVFQGKIGAASKVRIPFNEEDLKRLFESKEYLQGTHKSPVHHWSPLIGLFTGARQAEICQLYQEDIRYDDRSKIWFFDFNRSKADKSIKTDAGIRYVPIHRQLIKLGFLDFWKTIQIETPVFPQNADVEQTQSETVSRWFNRTYKGKRNCNINIPKGCMKDFHSFRNTLINALKQKGVPVPSAREIAGHEDDDMTYGRYANSLDLPARKKIINKVDYPSVDFSKIRKRRW